MFAHWYEYRGGDEVKRLAAGFQNMYNVFELVDMEFLFNFATVIHDTHNYVPILIFPTEVDFRICVCVCMCVALCCRSQWNDIFKRANLGLSLLCLNYYFWCGSIFDGVCCVIVNVCACVFGCVVQRVWQESANYCRNETQSDKILENKLSAWPTITITRLYTHV